MRITPQGAIITIAAMPYAFVAYLAGGGLLREVIGGNPSEVAGLLCVVLVSAIVTVAALVAARHEDMKKTRIGYVFVGTTAVLVAVLLRSFR